MAKSNTGRRRRYLVIALAVTLLVACVVVFHPAFQRKMLLDGIEPYVDSAQIERVHLTPWSLELSGATVDYRGGRFELDAARVRFGLLSLLLRKINVRELEVAGARIDLTRFEPAMPDEVGDESVATPFPGVLAALDAGLGYAVDNVGIDAVVHLSPGQSLRANLTGGGIRPDARGTLSVVAGFDGGDQGERIDVSGDIGLEQLRRGRFAALIADLEVRAQVPALTQPEIVQVSASVVPAAVADADTDGNADATTAIDAPQDVQTGDLPTLIAETLHLALRSVDERGVERAALTLDGTYNGNSGDFDGRYRLTANEAAAQRYVTAGVIAPAAQTLGGQVHANLLRLTGDLTVQSDLTVSQLRGTYGSDQLPQQLHLQNSLRLSLLADRQLRVQRLDTGLSNDEDVQSLKAALAATLDVSLDDPRALLRKEQTLLAFELPQIPLAWLDLLLPGYHIAQGALTGAFVITTDGTGAINLKPVRPLTLEGLSIDVDGESFIEGLNLAAMPRATYTPAGLSIALDELRVDAAGQVLFTGAVNADLPLAEGGATDLDLRVATQLFVHRLAAYLGVDYAGIDSLPERVALTLSANVQQRPQTRVVRRLQGALATDRGEQLLSLGLVQPIVIAQTGQGWAFANAEGDLATFNVSDIPLTWFSAFVPGGAIEGRLRRADFTLAMDGAAVARFAPAAPFRIDGLTVNLGRGPLLEDVDLTVSPRVRLSAEGVQIEYADLSVTGGGESLVTGGGRVGLERAPGATMRADGGVEVNLQALALQPLVAASLPAPMAGAARVSADYALVRDTQGIDVERLVANLFYDDARPRLSLEAKPPGLRVRTRLGGDPQAADRARGELLLSVADLAPGPFAAILRARGLDFGTFGGSVLLTSDGQAMNLRTVRPLAVTGVQITQAGNPLLTPFDLELETQVSLEGSVLTAQVERYRMVFDRRSAAPAVSGSARLVLDGAGDVVGLSALDADLRLSLPPLLDQPMAMPGHGLTAGNAQMRVALAADGRVEASVQVTGLQSRTPLPLQSLDLSVTGTRGADGRVEAKVPVTLIGKSGTSNVSLEVLAEGRSLDLNLASKVLYLNDVLGTINAIAAKAPSSVAAANDTAAAKPAAISRQPDERAFWSQVDRQLGMAIQMDRLFYTDYLEIVDVRANAALRADRLELQQLRARFHDSPLALDGVLAFAPGPTPYDLDLKASVEQLDLAQFLRELQPGARPRAEGLFDLRIDAFGQAPNLAQYRNDLFFDMQVRGRDGVFRLLDPDNPLVISSTTLASAVGELVSYVPTGLFGLGAVPRLVNYIKDVDYDRVDVQLVRDESRDVQIQRFVVQSPEVLMTAAGGIRYERGVDILDSPLTLDAQLNLRGEGAAIMYDMDLLEREQDAWGYWQGPRVKFSGSLAVMESNLGDTISRAGQGMVVGGLTRPVSGFIGNFRHRWLDEGAAPLDYDAVPANGDSQPQPDSDAQREPD